MADHEAHGRGHLSADQGLDEDTAQTLEAGRRLFAGPCDFLRGVAGLDQLPEFGLPEVAFAGRSNVGKSSLVNALTGRGSLARTSNTPGRTQELNFFDLGSRLILVDLPGYGFAKAPKEVVARWTELVFAYLRGRPTLTLVCVLIDARHGPKPVDGETMQLLGRAAVPYQVVLTKVDLVPAGELDVLVATLTSDLRRRLGALPQPLLTSSRKREGLEALRATLARHAGPSVGDAAR